METGTTVDFTPVKTEILANFNGNLDIILGIAGFLIGAGLVYRWVRRVSK